MTSVSRLQTALPTYASEALYSDDAAEPGNGVMYDVDAKRWGGAYWCMIHMAAYAYPDEPSAETRQAMFQQFDAMRYTIPCSACRMHYRQFWIEHPIDEALSSRDALIEWTTLLHERVNENVGAPPFDLAPYLARLLGEEVVVEDVDDDNDEPAVSATKNDTQPTEATTTKAAPAKKAKKEPAATPATTTTKRNPSRRMHSRRAPSSDHKTANRTPHGRESMRAAMSLAQSKALESMQRSRSMRGDVERNTVHTFTWKHYITQTQRQTPPSSVSRGAARHVRPPKDCPDCQKEIKASQF